MIIYKIKNVKTNMYSRGGDFPSWSKTGKIWKNIGHVKLHLRNVLNRGSYKSFDDWVVESYELKQTSLDTKSVEYYFNEIVQSKEKEKIDSDNQKKFLEETKNMALNRLSAEERKALGY